MQTPNSSENQKFSVNFDLKDFSDGSEGSLKLSLLVLEENPLLDEQNRILSLTNLVSINVFADG